MLLKAHLYQHIILIFTQAFSSCEMLSETFQQIVLEIPAILLCAQLLLHNCYLPEKYLFRDHDIKFNMKAFFNN